MHWQPSTSLRIALLVAALFTPSAASAKAIYLDNTKPPYSGDGTVSQPFSALNRAVNAAQTGDSILAKDGLYSQRVVIRKRLTIIASGRSKCNDSPGVYLYETPGYGGRCSRLISSVPNLGLEYVLSQQAASLWMIGDFQATLFRDVNFQGTSSTFIDEDRDLANDPIGFRKASSFRIEARNRLCGDAQLPGVYLYRDINFAGECIRLTRDLANLANTNFGDSRVASVRLVGGYRARLYPVQGYQGVSVLITTDNSDFGNDSGGIGRVSSVNVTGPFPEEEPVFHVQIRFRTGDSEPAGTDQDIVVSLNPGNATWLDYGRDDFEPRTHGQDDPGDTYDLLSNGIGRFSDIDWIAISKRGTDGWCISRIELLVNWRQMPVYAQDFTRCHPLDRGTGQSRKLVISHDDLRANANWVRYVPPNPSLPSPEDVGILRLTYSEIENIIEGIVGHYLHRLSGVHWGGIHNGKAVEVTGSSGESLFIDLDLESYAGENVDVNFDLKVSCTNGTVVASVENPRVHISWEAKLLAKIMRIPTDFDSMFPRMRQVFGRCSTVNFLSDAILIVP